jgi:hypothetical protein
MLKNQNITRRAAIKRFNHLLLGSATAYLVVTKSYQKPSLTKMKGLYDASAMADSTFVDPLYPPINPFNPPAPPTPPGYPMIFPPRTTP